MRRRAKGRYITAVIAAALILTVSPVKAQEPPKCYRRDDVAREAKERYGETQYATMTTNTGLVVELWVSPDGKTFTLFVSPSPDMLCVVGDGTDFKIVGTLGRGA